MPATPDGVAGIDPHVPAQARPRAFRGEFDPRGRRHLRAQRILEQIGQNLRENADENGFRATHDCSFGAFRTVERNGTTPRRPVGVFQLNSRPKVDDRSGAGRPPGATRRVRPGPRSTDRPVRLAETRATSPPQATVRPDPSAVQLTTPRRFARAIDRQTPSGRRVHTPAISQTTPNRQRPLWSTSSRPKRAFHTVQIGCNIFHRRLATVTAARPGWDSWGAPRSGAASRRRSTRSGSSCRHRLKVRYGYLAPASITSLPGTPRRHLWSPLPGHVDATRTAAAVGI